MNVAARRFLAFGVDWFVVATWGALLFGAVMALTGGAPPAPAGPWHGQLIGLLTMTLPVSLYFLTLESSRFRGTAGKRLFRLEVVTAAGTRLPAGRSALRTLAKFVPWECGHLVAQQAAFSGEAGMPSWVAVPMLLAVAGPLWWVTTIFRSGIAPYDRLAGSRVRRTALRSSTAP